MRKPIDIRDWWSQHGFWAAVLFVVWCFWLGTYGPTWITLVMPLSIVWSMATVVHLLTGRTAEMRFWRAYVFKWLSWWVLNALFSALVLGLMLALISSLINLGVYGQMAILLIFPTWRLCKHIAADLREIKIAQHAQNWQQYLKAAV